MLVAPSHAEPMSGADRAAATCHRLYPVPRGPDPVTFFPVAIVHGLNDKPDGRRRRALHYQRLETTG